MEIISSQDVGLAIGDCARGMPPGERAEAEHIVYLFNHLENYISEFEEAVDLHAHVYATFQRPEIPKNADGSLAMDGWTLEHHQAFGNKLHRYLNKIVIPARDAVMTVYHIEQVIIAIRSNTGRSPTLRERHDGKLSREAWKAFQTHFAAATRMRHAAAHSSEHMKTLAEWKRHAPVEPGRGMVGNAG